MSSAATTAAMQNLAKRTMLKTSSTTSTIAQRRLSSVASLAWMSGSREPKSLQSHSKLGISTKSLTHHKPNNTRTTTSATRSFSSYQNVGDLRTYPQYTVFGETCMLSVKVMLPAFRVLSKKSIVMDYNKRGRIVLEWMARDASGKPDREKSVRFALSPEECGLLLDQLPKEQEVEFVRRVSDHQFSNPQGFFPTDGGVGGDEGSGANPEKVMRIIPGKGGMTSFILDFEKDGVGGQTAGNAVSYNPDLVGPLEVIAQAGETQVMLTLIQHALPHLVGWTTSMEIAMQNALADALRREGVGGGSGSSGRGGPSYSSSDGGYGGGGNMPF